MSDAEPQSAVPKATPRWYRITPDRVVIALLALEVLLWLSDWFHWLPWHKGYAVLTAVGVVVAALVGMLFWFAVALLFRRRCQFSIRSLLVLSVVVAIPCGWLAMTMKGAWNQRKAVEAVTSTGGFVWDDYTCNAFTQDRDFPPDWKGNSTVPKPPGPEWLRTMLGEDFFTSVDRVDYPSYGHASNESLADLEDMPGLRELYLNDARFTDDGVRYIKGLRQLEYLDVSGTKITVRRQLLFPLNDN